MPVGVPQKKAGGLIYYLPFFANCTDENETFSTKKIGTWLRSHEKYSTVLSKNHVLLLLSNLASSFLETSTELPT